MLSEIWGHTVPKTATHSFDKAIGARLKLYRRRGNVSQTTLGKHVGVTYQQIQKYENGTNRVSAAMLFNIAGILHISVGELLTLDGHQPTTATSKNNIARFAKSREGKNLIRHFMAIRSPLLRHHIVGLVEARAANGERERRA